MAYTSMEDILKKYVGKIAVVRKEIYCRTGQIEPRSLLKITGFDDEQFDSGLYVTELESGQRLFISEPYCGRVMISEFLTEHLNSISKEGVDAFLDGICEIENSLLCIISEKTKERRMKRLERRILAKYQSDEPVKPKVEVGQTLYYWHDLYRFIAQVQVTKVHPDNTFEVLSVKCILSHDDSGRNLMNFIPQRHSERGIGIDLFETFEEATQAMEAYREKRTSSVHFVPREHCMTCPYYKER